MKSVSPSTSDIIICTSSPAVSILLIPCSSVVPPVASTRRP